MLELYIILSLGALGYLLNKDNNDVATTKRVVSKNEIPSMDNIYSSDKANATLGMTGKRADKMYNLAKNPKKTGVIDKNFQFLKENEKENNADLVKSLTGDYIKKENFTHNNAVPFFGGSIRQNMGEDVNRTKLENFTGVTDLYQNKCETKPFFKKTKENIYGTQNQSAYYQDRVVAPTSRNNVFPIPQVHVGPGLNKGYSAEPTGGFQQFDTREFEEFKTVDELRVATNPKLSYEGRVVDGLKTGLRGKIGEVVKNRPDTSFEQTPDMYLKTTAQYLKPEAIPEFVVPTQNRQTTDKEFFGTAFGHDAQARKSDPMVQESSRAKLKNFEPGPADLGIYGTGEKDDFGKSKILVYDNERDITSTKIYQGNVISLVKSIIAPIEDMIKITKKDEQVNNARQYGNMSVQIPEKATIYDPNQVARTTIKETLIHDTGTGILTGPVQLYVYDPDEIAKTTIRETLESDDYHLNMTAHAYKGVVKDPNDIARTTVKQTTEGLQRQYGNIDGAEDQGTYVNDYDAKNTQRQFQTDYEYIGDGYRDAGEGYLTNEKSARHTQKEFLHHEYFGGGDAENKAQMSYEDYQNMRQDPGKEVLLDQRIPVTEGAKSYNDCQPAVKYNKLECDSVNPRETNNQNRLYAEIPDANEINITKQRQDTEELVGNEENDRLDPRLLDAYRSNPYTFPLNSVF